MDCSSKKITEYYSEFASKEESKYKYEFCEELENKNNIISNKVLEHNEFEKKESIILKETNNSNYRILIMQSKLFLGDSKNSPDLLRLLFSWYSDYHIESNDIGIKITFIIPLKKRIVNDNKN